MAPFYEAHGRTWDTSLFEATWPATENYALFEDDARIGVLRLKQEADALYVSDLQISPEYRNRGAGTFAMQFVQRLAAERGLARIRLRVFIDNRARSLYRRLGFEELCAEKGLLLLERAADVPRPQ
jgi:ribosomal protein S18 acetylase RimI-like enzyme